MKNRFLQLLDNKNIEKLPFMPCLDGYAQSGLPVEYQNQHVIDMQMKLGIDMLRGINAYKEKYDSNITYEKTENGEYVIEKYNTPVGHLQKISRFVPESPFIPFPTEYLIKNRDDLKIFRYIQEHINPVAVYREMETYKRKYPEKIMSASLEDSPFYDLLTKLIGIENFTYIYMEDPAELEYTMEAMMINKRKYMEISAESPADVIICYENTNTANSMPDWIKMYAFPQLNEFANIAHGHNKPFLVHMCGKINLLLDDIAHCQFDGITEISPPPTGDCDFVKAVTIMENANMVIAGGIECNQFTMKDTPEFINSVRKFLDTIPKSPYFILGSGDAVPKGASADNLKEIYALSQNIKRII